MSYLEYLSLTTWQSYLERYTKPDFLSWLFYNLGKTFLVFVAVFILQRLFYRLIDKCCLNRHDYKIGLDEETASMLSMFLKTLVLYGGYLIALLVSLESFGLNILDELNLVAASGTLLKIIGIIVAGRIIVKFSRTIIERLFTQSARTNLFGEEKRLETLKVLCQSTVTYAIYFVVVLTILSAVGVNIASIIASAGILGLAVGFGAQNLVKDVITGFFLVLENYFTVGDYIQTAGVGGIVEETGLRSTKIRDWSGELHIIPNSQIDMVTNHCRGKARALVEIGIAYEEDIDHAVKVLQQEADQVAEEFKEVIIDPPKVLGVQNLGPSEVLIRVIGFTKAMEQWSLERELRRRLKQALDREGIEIPYPRRVIIQNTSGVKGE